MSNAWKGGSNRLWRETRDAILQANLATNAGRCAADVGVLCQRHNKPCPGICTGMADCVHHKRGKRYGDDRRYLVASCTACNLHIGDPEQGVIEPKPHSSW